MSRIGKKLIELPEKVKLNISGDGQVNVEGPKGKLAWTLPKQIKARLEGNKLTVERTGEARQVRALHGLSRALIANMVTGVSTGFVKDLEIQGVGFKAAVQGKVLNLSLGFSHPILFQIPDGLKITVTDNTKIKIEGIDRQVVGQAAADIRVVLPAGALQRQRCPLRRRTNPPQGRQNRPITYGYTKQRTQIRHQRLRKRVEGTPERPRLAVHFSGKNIYAQVIDDTVGRTIVSATTTEKEFKASKTTRANKETAGKVGKLVAESEQGQKHRESRLRSGRLFVSRQS